MTARPTPSRAKTKTPTLCSLHYAALVKSEREIWSRAGFQGSLANKPREEEAMGWWRRAEGYGFPPAPVETIWWRIIAPGKDWVERERNQADGLRFHPSSCWDHPR